MKSLDLNSSPQSIMHQYGKSFYFASMALSKNTAIKVFSLYQYCRYVDDCGDELGAEEGQKRLSELINVIDGRSSSPKKLKLLVDGIINNGVKPDDLKVLISGALYEANGKIISSKKDLIHYCYLVAGVVGKMMCPLIGVKNVKAYPFSIDLGIAMQLTNICRDVLEDHNKNRSYLWELKTTNNQLSDTKENKQIILKHLDLADQYYESSFGGLSYIPIRSRLAIFIASEIYRAIGKKIKKTDSLVFQQRIYLSSAEKFFVCLKSSFKLLKPSFWTPKSHKSELHSELKNRVDLSVKVVEN